MAPTGQGSATSTSAARRTAVATARGLVLAAHAAVGVTQPVDGEALRLLRACEGLARVAVGRLEHLSRQAVVAAPDQAGQAGGGVKKRRRTRRKRAKGMDVDEDGRRAEQLDAASPAAATSSAVPSSASLQLALGPRWMAVDAVGEVPLPHSVPPPAAVLTMENKKELRRVRGEVEAIYTGPPPSRSVVRRLESLQARELELTSVLGVDVHEPLTTDFDEHLGAGSAGSSPPRGPPARLQSQRVRDAREGRRRGNL